MYPGIVLAHQLFGVTADVREVADRIAALGFVVLAPDFFHRAEPGVELPATDEGRARGFELMRTLSRTGVIEDVEAAIATLESREDVERVAGMVGLSLGGHLAYLAATRLPLPVTLVLYAGWLTGTDIPVSTPEPTLELSAGIKGRLVYVVGDADHVITAGQRAAIADRLRADGVDHEVVVIEGAPHAFLSDPDSPYLGRTWELIARELSRA